MKNKNVLLMGYGAIGKRHSNNLIELGITLHIITKYPDNTKAVFHKNLDEIEDENIDSCIISSPTARHLEDLQRCLKIRGLKKVLIEKPLESTYSKGAELKELADEYGLEVYVGYNLRFLDAMDYIKDFVRKQRGLIKIVEVVAGQSLLEWRPEREYSQSYSACRGLGGGVDLDLSHEIDYILMFFGDEFKEKKIWRNKVTSLKIDSPDLFKLFLDYGGFIVDVSLDYIRTPKERYIKIICEGGNNLYYNYYSGELELNGEKKVMQDNIAQSYKRMMESFVGLGKKDILCTIEQGLNVLKVLEV